LRYTYIRRQETEIPELSDPEIYLDKQGIPRWSATDEPFDCTPLPDYTQVSGSAGRGLAELLFYVGLFSAVCIAVGVWQLTRKAD